MIVRVNSLNYAARSTFSTGLDSSERAIQSSLFSFQGVKGRMYGFELHIQDKLYSLIADSQSEMDSWIAALGKVTGIDMDSGGKTSNFSVIGKLKGPKVHQSLRESLKE